MSLHPNWKVLATVPIRIKQFVSESNNLNCEQENGESNLKVKVSQVSQTTGEEVKKIYTDIVNDPDLKKTKTTKKNDNVEISQKPARHAAKRPPVFNINTFMRYATENDCEQIEDILENNSDAINNTDQFGWTALMCAACSGSTDVVKVLLNYGADYKIMDKKGNTAFSLAKEKGKKDVLLCIAQYRQRKASEQFHGNCELEPASDETQEADIFYCEVCKLPFKECTVEGHRSSTLHLFNDKQFNFGTVYGIPECNKGYQLMLKTGWNKESGLGPSGTGQKFPVKTVIRTRRTGLGVKQTSPRVTHFKAKDERAVQRKSVNKIQTMRDILHNEQRDKHMDRYLRKELS